MSATDSRARRCIQLFIALLQKGRLRTSQAKALFPGVSKRTVLRDLQLLQELAQLEIEGEGNDRVWVLTDGFRLHTLPFVQQIAFSFGRDLTRFLEGTELYAAFESVGDDRAPRTPSYMQRDLRLKFFHVAEPARSYLDHGEVLFELLEALIRTRTLHLDYLARSGERQLRGLEPLTLALYRRALYLIARDDRGRTLRLAVERIQGVELGPAFAYPDDYDPEDELSPWFGIVAHGSTEDVVLHFDARVAELVTARRWHPTAATTTLPGGGVELRMHTGGPELLRWILEWGETCRVVAPRSLRDGVIRSLRASLAAYDAEDAAAQA